MEEIVLAESFIDGSNVSSEELNNFRKYINREKDLSEFSGIANYEACWKPLLADYFENEDRSQEENGPSKEEITPEFTTAMYHEFKDSK